VGQIVIVFRGGAVRDLTYFDAEGEADAFARGVRTMDDDASAYVLPRDMADLNKHESGESNAAIDRVLALTVRAITRAQIDIRSALKANLGAPARTQDSDVQAVALLRFVICAKTKKRNREAAG
jgi:hypothetical protein